MTDVYIVKYRYIESFLTADDAEQLVLVLIIINLALRFSGDYRRNFAQYPQRGEISQRVAVEFRRGLVLARLEKKYRAAALLRSRENTRSGRNFRYKGLSIRFPRART